MPKRERTDADAASPHPSAAKARPDVESDVVWRLLHQTNRSDVIRIDRCVFGKADCERCLGYLNEFDEIRDIRLQMSVGASTLPRFLAHLIRNAPTLEKIDLSRNRIDTTGALAVAETCLKLHRVRVLNMSYNPIGDEGALAILKAVINRPVFLVMRHCNLSDTFANELARNGVCSDSVTLCVAENRIGKLGLIALSQLPAGVSINASRQHPKSVA